MQPGLWLRPAKSLLPLHSKTNKSAGRGDRAAKTTEKGQIPKTETNQPPTIREDQTKYQTKTNQNTTKERAREGSKDKREEAARAKERGAWRSVATSLRAEPFASYRLTFCLLPRCKQHVRRPDGSVGMALVLPALTDCRWWFESLLVHSGVSSATRRQSARAVPVVSHG